MQTFNRPEHRRHYSPYSMKDDSTTSAPSSSAVVESIANFPFTIDSDFDRDLDLNPSLALEPFDFPLMGPTHENDDYMDVDFASSRPSPLVPDICQQASFIPAFASYQASETLSNTSQQRMIRQGGGAFAPPAIADGSSILNSTTGLDQLSRLTSPTNWHWDDFAQVMYSGVEIPQSSTIHLSNDGLVVDPHPSSVVGFRSQVGGSAAQNAAVERRRGASSTPQYTCDRCSSTFTRAYNLREHLQRHANMLEYTCEACSMRFNTKGDCVRHMKMMHGGRLRI
ncbi:hypothetical protein BD626DRAFT_635798 [Schizophyllum amplum]|uniref:C2H2-type domain-containing protein n=1 Tax=Schizophyllum amplum TaxID=97359 RepID=A0A550BV74_9AGAR|nr:hypothetical protein BD626DRAFT_635798 [Auriculariopsis ampla]